MKQLIIDTSHKTLAIALVEDETLVMNFVAQGQKNHAQTLMPMVEAMMNNAKWIPQDLDAVIVAKGPGSYTGVRIGVTTAKTLARTLNIPLKMISSLELLAYNARSQHIIVPMMNARRQHVFAGIYQTKDNQLINLLPDQYISVEELQEHLHRYDDVYLLGDATDFEWTLSNATIETNALYNSPQAYAGIYCQANVFEGKDIDAAVPSYLKAVEAEEKWQQAHPTESVAHYIETTK